MELRPILFVIGMLLCILSLSMLAPLITDLIYGHSDWQVFFFCIILCGFFGGSLVISTRGPEFRLSIRQTFVLTVSSWIALSFFAALPFFLCDQEMSFTDSFFEAMSGITTTGATVMTGLSDAPPGILIWRSILQWLGGIGIIVMALSVLPFLKVGGMQLFRTESSQDEKALPRAARLSSAIVLIYLALTLICMMAYFASGLSLFDSLAHAMTTVATGGFSTFDTSFSHYTSPSTEVIATIFMVASGLPFVLYLKAIQGRLQKLLSDSQVRMFIALVLGVTAIMTAYLSFSEQMSILESLRRASFNVASVITGTGYSSADYSLWGPLAISVFFFLMVVGGCAGSTTCGIKVFRFQILYAVIAAQIKRLIHPHGVFVPYYNGRPLPQDVPLSVMSFFFVYAFCFVFLALLLSLTGLDFVTATSGAVSAISNVGPGLGPIIGPSGTYAALPDTAKWILSFGMLLGRLELFTILVLLSPHFWRD